MPFSRFGSYHAVFEDVWDNPLGKAAYLRTVHAKTVTPRPELFRLDAAEGRRRVPSRREASPSVLRFKVGRRRGVSLCLPDEGSVRLRGEGCGMRLEVPPETLRIAYPAHDGRWVIVPSTGLYNYSILCRRGRLDVRAPWRTAKGRGSPRCEKAVFYLQPDADGVFDAGIAEFRSRLPDPPHGSFDQAAREVERDYRRWLKKMPPPRKGFEKGWEPASYLGWSAVVAARENFTRPAMLMSKAHMKNVWSWDHCFNAMALGYRHPGLAWDQFMVMADHQDENGFMPDSINDATSSWHHGKPPVHGWALRFCDRRNPAFLNPERLEEAYAWLSTWTRWWIENRTWPETGLPYYTHGNDSGWDNATIFDVGSPTASPDLAAHLSVQMDVLAELARRLGRERAALDWRRRSDEMLQTLIDRLWRGDRFVGILCPTGRDIECQSLITCLPLVLGRRLPPQIGRALVGRVRRHLTRHGLATEQPDSDRFSGDFHSYWRGAIWAPPVMLIVDGLSDMGQNALARTISRRYCRAAARCLFRENFHALTGAGCMDFAYTWTSSVYLVLAHEFV